MKILLSVLAIGSALLANAVGTFSLIEINPLHANIPLTPLTDSAKTYYGAGSLSGFIQMNGKLYFSAQKTPGDDELWVTDGTIQGTTLVNEINPGQGAAIGNLVSVNNHILFMATDNDTVWDLWSTDGTNSGTAKIYALNAPSNNALGPYNVSLIGNRLVFCAQQKLLISDGTASGTDSLLSIANYSQGFGYCELNGYVYFVLPEITGGNELWRTDGTLMGTTEVLNLGDPPYDINSAKEVISFNGKIYLSAIDSSQITGLFSFDGAINGQLSRVTSGSDILSNLHGLNKYDSAFYFIANNGAYSNVYRLSETDSIPVPLIPNSNFSSLSNLTFANNTAYCMEPGNNQIHAIELSGLSYSKLTLQGYHLPNYPYTDDNCLVAIGQEIYFEAYDSASNNQVLMQSDFTPAGTETILPGGANTDHPFNCYLNNGINDVFDLQIWNNKIIMPANFTDAGRELWIFDTAAISGIDQVKEDGLFAIYPNPASNELTVKINPCGNCEQNISIMNIDGQIVLKETLNDAITPVKLSSLASGNYFVTLIENGEAIDAKPFVLMK